MQPKSEKEMKKAFAGENSVQITDKKTERHCCEIRCGACGKIFYADKATADHFNRLLEQDLDSPFLCGDCQNAFEESVIEDR